MTKALSTSLSARSNGLDDIDGGPERRVYTQMRCIEQVRVRRRLQWGRGAPRIPLVAAEQVGEHVLFLGHFAAPPQFPGPAAGPHFGGGNDKELNVGTRRDHGADIPPVEHGSRRFGGKTALIVDQRLPYLGDGGNHGGGFGA